MGRRGLPAQLVAALLALMAALVALACAPYEWRHELQWDAADQIWLAEQSQKFVGLEKPSLGFDPTYFVYDEESLVVFSRSYRSWGPFWHRSDLVRLTVTVRARNEKQLIVRAAAQFYLRPIEDPEPYQSFFRTLEQTLFVDRQQVGAAQH